MVLSPKSKYAVDRAKEIGGTYTPAKFKSELKSFKESLEMIQKETETKPGALDIVEYLDRPGMPVYLVVKSNGTAFGFSSFFLGEPTGVAFPHMKWTMAEFSVVQPLLEYVEAKWKRNRPEDDTTQATTTQ